MGECKFSSSTKKNNVIEIIPASGKDGSEKKHTLLSHKHVSGQISIIPKPEFSGDFGGIPLLFTTM